MSKKTLIEDRHHILFPRCDWNQGYALLLRRVFIRTLPVDVHRGLHHDALKRVPVPGECALKSLWEYYQGDRKKVDKMSFGEACDWLVRHSPNKEFQDAIIRQRAYAIKSGVW